MWTLLSFYRYEAYVDSAYKDFLKNEGKAEALADVDLTGAIDMYVESGQWTRALETASSHSAELLHKYLAKYATSMIKVRAEYKVQFAYS